MTFNQTKTHTLKLHQVSKQKGTTQKKTTKQTKKASFFLLFYTIIFNHTFFGVICDVLRNLRTQKHKNQKCSILLQENITDPPTFKKIQVWH